MMTVHDLETPCVLIDMSIMENNIRQMQARCNLLGKDFRAHIKTHKIPQIAWVQVLTGAVGIACQKVSEAEVFADAGFDNIQIPYNIVGERKLDRLLALAKQTRLTVSADDLAVVAGLASAAARHDTRLRVMVDLGTTMRRTGAALDQIVPTARAIVQASHLDFAGVLIYPSTADNREMLQAALSNLSDAGIAVESISGGGMGGARDAELMPEVTELRVGTYVFNDWNSVRAGYCAPDDCAMRVRATVVSRPDADRGFLDAGSKTLSSDTDGSGYGHIVEYPDARIVRLSEEHAHCDFSACQSRPQVGEIVHVIPMHTCVVSNLHDHLIGVRGQDVIIDWQVKARGCVV
jgi:D-serine deaminase-like pyridoxal phosphate-dependent protein